jgi:hypothetical protein
MSLLAVVHLAGTASADPEVPRTLLTGAPACGNVMFKYAAPREDPLCAVFENLRDLEELGRKFDAELTKRDVKTAALTLAPAPRPRL